MRKPPWHEKVRRLLASGKTQAEAAREAGIQTSSVAVWFGPRALAYQMKYASPSYQQMWGYDDGFPGTERVMEDAAKDPFLKEDLEAKMSDRNFEDVKLFADGQHKSGKLIKCSKQISPKCRKKEEFYNSSGATSPVHARKAFQNRGWVVGGGPKADVCPECFNLMTSMRREKLHKNETPVITPVPTPPPAIAAIPEASGLHGHEKKAEPMLVASKPVIPAARPPVLNNPPKPISVKDVDRTAKRLIDAALDKHYFSERGGYVDGFSDDKIAEDLKCPTEWVAAVREEFFGPNTSALNLQKDYLALEALAKEVKELERRVVAGIERMAEVDKNTNAAIVAFEKKRVEFQDAYNKVVAKVKAL